MFSDLEDMVHRADIVLLAKAEAEQLLARLAVAAVVALDHLRRLDQVLLRLRIDGVHGGGVDVYGRAVGVHLVHRALPVRSTGHLQGRELCSEWSGGADHGGRCREPARPVRVGGDGDGGAVCVRDGGGGGGHQGRD